MGTCCSDEGAESWHQEGQAGYAQQVQLGQQAPFQGGGQRHPLVATLPPAPPHQKGSPAAPQSQLARLPSKHNASLTKRLTMTDSLEDSIYQQLKTPSILTSGNITTSTNFGAVSAFKGHPK